MGDVRIAKKLCNYLLREGRESWDSAEILWGAIDKYLEIFKVATIAKQANKKIP